MGSRDEPEAVTPSDLFPPLPGRDLPGYAEAVRAAGGVQGGFLHVEDWPDEVDLAELAARRAKIMGEWPQPAPPPYPADDEGQL